MMTTGQLIAELQERDFVISGDVSSWLTTPFFGLKHARSSEAEKAIEDAKKVQSKKNVKDNEVDEVSQRLIKYLGADDKFWPRWIAFAERYGVEL